MTAIQQPSIIIGSLIFCSDCGNLLDMPGGDEDNLLCNQCGNAYRTHGKEATHVVTASSDNAFQSALKAKRSLVQQSKQQAEGEVTIEENCPNCGHNEMAYHTMQLRSADEGQTVFYNCKKCGYKYSINS